MHRRKDVNSTQRANSKTANTSTTFPVLKISSTSDDSVVQLSASCYFQEDTICMNTKGLLLLLIAIPYYQA